MHRLFVAIRPPAADPRASCSTLMGGVSGARWQSDDQLHLTLRFIGEVDRHLAGDVDAALGAIHHPPLRDRANGLGAFDRRGEPVTRLGRRRAARAAQGASQEGRPGAASGSASSRTSAPIMPHITLARLQPRRRARSAACSKQSGGLASPPFAVERIPPLRKPPHARRARSIRSSSAIRSTDQAPSRVSSRSTIAGIGGAEQPQVHQRREQLVERPPLLPARLERAIGLPEGLAGGASNRVSIARSTSASP